MSHAVMEFANIPKSTALCCVMKDLYKVYIEFFSRYFIIDLILIAWKYSTTLLFLSW